MGPHSPDEIDAQAYELEARAAKLHADAARIRARRTAAAPADDWVPLAKLPLAKKSARALAKSRAVESKLVGGRLYVLRSSFDGFMRSSAPTPAPEDEDLREELGLAPKAATR
jgi:hypothetical protein